MAGRWRTHRRPGKVRTRIDPSIVKENDGWKRQPWDPPTKRQWKRLVEIKRRTSMTMPATITYGIADRIIKQNETEDERLARSARGRRKGFYYRDRARKRKATRAP